MKLKNRHKRKERLSVRLFMSLFLFSFVVLTILWVSLIIFLKDVYKEVKLSNIQRATEELTENINSSNIGELAQEYALKYDTCVEIVDSKWRIIASECVNSSCRIHSYATLGLARFYFKVKENGGEYIERYVSSEADNDPTGERIHDPAAPPGLRKEEQESIIFARIIETDDGNEYLLVLNAVLSPLQAVIQSLKLIFTAIALFMLVASVAISLIFSKYTLTPISKINRTARLLAQGDYSVNFDESSYVEISQLAQTLNYAAKELSSVEATRRELVANVSHDLRTPLTLIGGYAEMLRDFPEEDNAETLGAIIGEVAHMTNLVNDMTDVSKYNAGVQKLSISEFNLTELIKEVADRLTKLNDQYGINIGFEHDGEVIITADNLKITQVIYNFLNNAVTHTGEDKKIYIKQEIVEEDKIKYALVSITDTGLGIPRENVKLIWDRYIKIDKTYQRAHTGSGLGLNIVKSILELHKMEYGVIPVEEQPNHKGCTFWFKARVTDIIK